MIGSFPCPYPDELFYSICARYCDRMQYPSWLGVFEALFGTTRALAPVAFPHRLKTLVSSLPPEHPLTVDRIIDHHSLLPFYSRFIPNDRLRTICELMEGDSGTGLYSRMGSLLVQLPRYFRFCPQCIHEDRKQFGECYWHRVHQIFGVEVCPIHVMRLEQSEVLLGRRFDRRIFVSAEVATRNLPISSKHNKPLHQEFVRIAQDVAWLLCEPDRNPDLEILNKRYRLAILNKGFAFHTGKLRTSKLIKAFNAYHPPDVLVELACEIDESLDRSWISSLLHVSKRYGTRSPIQHLLVIHFLGYSVEEFFNLPSKEEPFGKGPWPCLNPVCQHYQQLYITSYTLKYTRTGREPIATFSCECGFVYQRVWSIERGDSPTQIDQIVSYGPLWEAKLVELWLDPKCSALQAGRHLGVCGTTITRWAAQLGLPLESKTRSKTLTRLPTHSCIDSRRSPITIDEDRSSWLACLEEHPGEGVSVIRTLIPDVEHRLRRHDAQWLKEHIPPRKIAAQKSSPIDWSSRDAELAQAVVAVAAHIKSFQGRPKRVSTTALARAIDSRWLTQSALRNLPLTARALSQITETREQCAIRRVRWATECYRSEGVCPSRNQFIVRASIQNCSSVPQVQEEVDKALLSLS